MQKIVKKLQKLQFLQIAQNVQNVKKPQIRKNAKYFPEKNSRARKVDRCGALLINILFGCRSKKKIRAKVNSPQGIEKSKKKCFFRFLAFYSVSPRDYRDNNMGHENPRSRFGKSGKFGEFWGPRGKFRKFGNFGKSRNHKFGKIRKNSEKSQKTPIFQYPTRIVYFAKSGKILGFPRNLYKIYKNLQNL